MSLAPFRPHRDDGGRLRRIAGPRCGVIAAIHLAALAVMAADRIRLVRADDFPDGLGAAEPGFSRADRAARQFRRRCRSLLFAAVVALSQLKFSILWMVINFFDVLIIDSDTVSFLLSVFPDLRTDIVFGACRRSGPRSAVADRSVSRAAAGFAAGAAAAPPPSPGWRSRCRRSLGSSFRASITFRPSFAPASPRAMS